MKPQLLIDWNHHNVTGWLCSEKLDGWRMIWDGKQFLTRQGTIFQAPREWFAGMPDIPLDGELFAGRGTFNSIRERMKQNWQGLKFHVFDLPSPAPFHARFEELEKIPLPQHCALINHFPILSTAEWEKQASSIALDGGEGIIARNPSAPYKSGRDSNILRLVPQNPNLNRLTK
jgi:DNA ligase-1